jgi:hypothetical protein
MQALGGAVGIVGGEVRADVSKGKRCGPSKRCSGLDVMGKRGPRLPNRQMVRFSLSVFVLFF